MSTKIYFNYAMTASFLSFPICLPSCHSILHKPATDRGITHRRKVTIQTGVFTVFHTPSSEIFRQHLKLDHGQILPHPLQLIITIPFNPQMTCLSLTERPFHIPYTSYMILMPSKQQSFLVHIILSLHVSTLYRSHSGVPY
jgi:hypothetical protein